MEQINIFDELYPRYVLNENKKTRLITLFSGYDSQKLAFNYLGKEVEHYRVCEFDKYAINTLNEIHNTNFETTDIKSIGAEFLNIVEKDKYNYIMTYSFPCTDLSLAGKRQGMERDSGTRSGLLWEVERLLKETKELPDVLIMENVPQVLKANGWYEWCEFLENLGYNNYAEVINAKRFGIPQNRERCFMVSILGDYSYNFPKGFELKYRLKDLLEEKVDEKYYLSDRQIKCLSSTEDFNGYKRGKQFLKNINREITTTITASGSDRSSDTFVCEDTKVIGKIEQWHQRGFIYDENGIIPTLCSTDYKTPKLVQHSIKNNHNIDVLENKNMKQKLCNNLIKNGVREEYQGMYQYSKSDNFMNGKDRFTKNKELSDTILTQPKEGVVVKVGNYSPSGHNAASIVDSEGIAPTVMENHGTVTATVVNAEINPKLVGGIGAKKSNGGTQYYQQDRVYDSESIAMCHPANLPGGSYKYQVKEKRKSCYNCKHFYYDTFCGFNYPMCSKYDSLYNKESICDNCLDYEETEKIEYQDLVNLRIRKLTPKECFRLMGVKDTDYNKITCSNAQKYKQAGNSIVTTCLMAIYSQLYKDCDYKSKIDDLLKELTTNQLLKE